MAEFVALVDTVIPHHWCEKSWRGFKAYFFLQGYSLSVKFAVCCEAIWAEHLWSVSTRNSFAIILFTDWSITILIKNTIHQVIFFFLIIVHLKVPRHRSSHCTTQPNIKGEKSYPSRFVLLCYTVNLLC